MNNLEKRANFLRKTLIRNDKYLLAQIGGQKQDPLGKVLDVYFRYKDYLDPIENPDWFSASLEEVWSPKFLGLKENFLNIPLERIKKLEFQNPPYSAAFKVSGRTGDPRKYTKVFTLQIAGCNLDCNYCYVPTQLKSGDPRFGKYFSAKEIVDQFFKIKETRENEEWNVLRISGGEPLTIVPEIVLDVQKEIEKRSPQTYIWVETNLSCLPHIKKFGEELKEIFQTKNIGVEACFKGVDKNDFSLFTGAEKDSYNIQFETARTLINLGADIYFYLPALVYEGNIKEKTEKFVRRLLEIHKNLPLRLEVISIIEDYPASRVNIREKAQQGRPLPEINQRTIFDLWYNKVIPQFYLREELKKYCCEVEIH